MAGRAPGEIPAWDPRGSTRVCWGRGEGTPRLLGKEQTGGGSERGGGLLTESASRERAFRSVEVKAAWPDPPPLQHLARRPGPEGSRTWTDTPSNHAAPAWGPRSLILPSHFNG